jgi:uncharacterized protein
VRSDVTFPSADGMSLHAWLFTPDAQTAGPRPAISMAHGYAGLKDQGLEPFARVFADAGFVVLAHDHRNFGASEGEPRGDIDPWRQIADWRRAISFLEALPDVDPSMIGIWGTSYAGGHAIVLGATDRRIGAVVAQVPTISGFQQGLRRVAPEAIPTLEQAFADDDRAQLQGRPPRTQRVVSDDPKVPAAYRSKDAIEFYVRARASGVWENSVTLQSSRAARMYEPGVWAPRVSPTPLLMIVALSDTITLTDLALAAYEQALEPKKLVTVPGGHFDPYEAEFERSSRAAVEWFEAHLGAAPVP